MKLINRLATLACLLFFTACVWSGEDNWYQLENSHFIMYSAASEKTSRKLFTELEEFRALVLNFISFNIPPDAEKIKIILFKNIWDLKNYTWNRDIAGFVIPTKHGAIIVQPASTSPYELKTRHIIYHEFVHTLLRFYPKKLPGWYQEGLAEVFGATQYRSGKFDVGTAPLDRLREASYGLKFASFDDIVADKFEMHQPGYAEDPYVQYWMLADYFELGNKKRTKDLQVYLRLYNDGMDSLKAFRFAFNESPEQLWQGELKHYFRRAHIPGFLVKVPPSLSDLKISITPADMPAVEEMLATIGWYASAAAEKTRNYRKSAEILNYLTKHISTQSKWYLPTINQYVWLLSTCPDKWARDGKEAVILGERYIKDKTNNILYLDTLAAAYAETGRFDEAIALQTGILARLKNDNPRYADFSERLQDYRNHKPWRTKEQ